jgi:cellulose synthase/poly-beta-1,6-N-acetylglucosamine synthase-like glycosyltransferase
MVVIVYFTFLFLVAIMAFYLVRHYLFSLTALYKRKGQSFYALHGLSYRPTVTILIPAKNEEAVLGRLLHRVTELTYPKEQMDVVVIDDASTDDTGRIADEFADVYSYFKVVHRNISVGGKGKPSALNEALRYAKGEILVCFDADYYPQVDIIENLTAYFADPEVGAVQGRVTVLNEHSSWVSRLVALERTGGYRVDQLARDDLGLIPQYGGTVCGVRRDLMDFLGGWDTEALTEDTDLTFRVYLAGYKVRYVNEAECYEEVVETWRAYWRQRHRWAKGHMQCCFKHLIPLVRSRNLRLREKIDGVLLLNVYFVPIIVGLSWILGAAIFFLWPTSWFESIWSLLPVFLYSSVGNFALFFEVGVAVYLDRRVRLGLLIPLLLFSFVFNTLICFKALLDLCYSKIVGKKMHAWAKTLHNGGKTNWL